MPTNFILPPAGAEVQPRTCADERAEKVWSFMSTMTTSDRVPGRAGGSQTAGRFYPQLDGLRAIAVLLVLVSHMSDLALPHVVGYRSAL
jgi:hypothetical protein